jgi:hypothetical protein
MCNFSGGRVWSISCRVRHTYRSGTATNTCKEQPAGAQINEIANSEQRMLLAEAKPAVECKEGIHVRNPGDAARTAGFVIRMDAPAANIEKRHTVNVILPAANASKLAHSNHFGCAKALQHLWAGRGIVWVNP